MEQELVNGVWKRKLIRHIGTAKSDLDLSLLMERAKQTLDQLERPNQLRFPFPSDIETSRLRTIGEFHQGADIVLGHLFDRRHGSEMAKEATSWTELGNSTLPLYYRLEDSGWGSRDVSTSTGTHNTILLSRF